MPFSFNPNSNTSNQINVTDPSLPQLNKGFVPPQKDTPSVAGRVPYKASPSSLIQTLALLVFILTSVSALGIFGYSYYLNSQIESSKAELSSYEQGISRIPLSDMRNLSNRIKSASKAMKEHSSVRSAFSILEHSVENAITYKKFDLSYSSSKKAYTLKLEGVSPTYASLAQQIDTLKRDPYSKYIATVDIGKVEPDKTGEIKFEISMPISIVGVLPEKLVLDQVVEDIEEDNVNKINSNSSTTPPINNTNKP